MKKYLFYPGCSLQRNARAYLDSTMTIRDDINIVLEEIQDWNCCGATEYKSVYRVPSHALVGRNLALAEQQIDGADTLVASCSACYLNLVKTESHMRHSARLESQVNRALAAGGLHYTPGALQVRHLLDIIFNDVGLDIIREKVVRPLTGLRVAPYYGCMIVRPDPDNRYGNPEYPVALDQLLKALGAEVIYFPQKTHCCSGHMTQVSPEVAYELIRRLISAADQFEADLMATLCPMCQLNLDAYQADTNRYFKTEYHMPVLYFTQLMGLAFGYDANELGIGKEFVDAREALAKIGVEVPIEEEQPKRRTRRRAKKEGLPMPKMPEEEVK
ncbi:MAG: CoB--CoM heterodisulfide reductase iron-sulfur subunit B family protein [Candidatus Promineifilaceae bacterium]|nr:CoB--CoM heterodisulfide reductase iron-sulfur subunit B family protein [Candidatus Promineifilaceae bacterium]